METAFNFQQYIDVSLNDEIRVSQPANNQFAIFQFKDQNTNNTENISVTWEGQSSLAPSTKKVVLQIYDNEGDTWEDLAENNAAGANTDFELSAIISSDLDHYYDGSNIISCRVYQGTD